jgi:hypothetical protein
MAININAKTTGVGGLETSADNSGNINIQSGGTTVMSVTSSGVAVTGSFSQNGAVYSTQPSFRNLIINGDMRIDQRNAGSAVTSATNVYLTDRWQLQINGTTNTPSFQQVTDAPTGFQYSLKATSNGSETLPTNGAVTPRQRIEGFNSAHLLYGTSNAKTVTISFWVKSSLTGTWTISIINGSFSRSYIAEYTINSANTWEYKTVTIPGDTTGTWSTDNTTGLIVQFPVDTDTILDATPNAWLAGNYRTTSGSNRLLGTSGATWQVTGVQLEVGSTATDFENLPYDVQLARCERYYQKNYLMEDAPGVSTSGENSRYMHGSSDGSSNGAAGVFWRCRMRATPTVTWYTDGGTQGQWNYARSGASGTATFTAYRVGDTGANGFLGVGAAWATCSLWGNWTAEAEL